MNGPRQDSDWAFNAKTAEHDMTPVLRVLHLRGFSQVGRGTGGCLDVGNS